MIASSVSRWRTIWRRLHWCSLRQDGWTIRNGWRPSATKLSTIWALAARRNRRWIWTRRVNRSWQWGSTTLFKRTCVLIVRLMHRVGSVPISLSCYVCPVPAFIASWARLFQECARLSSIRTGLRPSLSFLNTARRQSISSGRPTPWPNKSRPSQIRRLLCNRERRGFGRSTSIEPFWTIHHRMCYLLLYWRLLIPLIFCAWLSCSCHRISMWMKRNLSMGAPQSRTYFITVVEMGLQCNWMCSFNSKLVLMSSIRKIISH